eukprot:196703-Chlamydomonas_euryale.AAC.1
MPRHSLWSRVLYATPCIWHLAAAPPHPTLHTPHPTLHTPTPHILHPTPHTCLAHSPPTRHAPTKLSGVLQRARASKRGRGINVGDGTGGARTRGGVRCRREHARWGGISCGEGRREGRKEALRSGDGARKEGGGKQGKGREKRA